MKNKLYMFIALCYLFLFGCVATNTQRVTLPDSTEIVIKSPKNVKKPVTLDISYTTLSNEVQKVQINSQGSVQYDTTFTKASFKNIKVWHYGGLGLVLLGVWMMFLKVPKDLISGLCVAGSGLGLGIVGSMLPFIGANTMLIVGVIAIVGIGYVVVQKYLHKKNVE